MRELILNGVGFKCFYSGRLNFLCFQLGLSHYVKVSTEPFRVIIKAKKNKLLLISEHKSDLGELFKLIQQLRLPDPYKSRGIQVKGVKYVLKQGKKR